MRPVCQRRSLDVCSSVFSWTMAGRTANFDRSESFGCMKRAGPVGLKMVDIGFRNDRWTAHGAGFGSEKPAPRPTSDLQSAQCALEKKKVINGFGLDFVVPSRRERRQPGYPRLHLAPRAQVGGLNKPSRDTCIGRTCSGTRCCQPHIASFCARHSSGHAQPWQASIVPAASSGPNRWRNGVGRSASGSFR
jgi:hypothetical protein